MLRAITSRVHRVVRSAAGSLAAGTHEQRELCGRPTSERGGRASLEGDLRSVVQTIPQEVISSQRPVRATLLAANCRGTTAQPLHPSCISGNVSGVMRPLGTAASGCLRCVGRPISPSPLCAHPSLRCWRTVRTDSACHVFPCPATERLIPREALG